jgi:hypothetical protein
MLESRVSQRKRRSASVPGFARNPNVPNPCGLQRKTLEKGRSVQVTDTAEILEQAERDCSRLASERPNLGHRKTFSHPELAGRLRGDIPLALFQQSA